MKLRFIILTLALFAVSACNGVNINVTRGSGNVITESRAVSNFSNVVLAGIGELSITQGDNESLTIEADDNLMPLITTKVENGTLTIGLDTNRGTISLNPTRPIKYTLQVKTLNSIQLAGAGNISTPSLKSETLTIGSSGAGNLNLSQVNAKTVNVTLSGAGNISLNGQVETQTATLTGLGSYTASDLKSNAATVTISGAGSATVWAAQTLKVTLSGVGSVSYYGSPQVTQQISGVGSIKKLGDK